MIDFINKLEKDFQINIKRSPEYTLGVNSFDLNEDGEIRMLCLDGLSLRDLEILLPVSEKMNELWLESCEIEKLDSLKHFPNLIKLGLYDNPILTSTLSSLEFLTKLKVLDLGGTNISDTSSLASLKCLQELHLNGSDVLNEINGLKELDALEILNLEFTQISDINNININESVRFINLSNSKIKHISGLDSFPNLQELELSSNPISKISGLEKSNSLLRLIISSTDIHSIEGLKHLSDLEILDLGNNSIEKIQGLESLTSLRELSLNQNAITKVENLDDLHNLELLLLEKNKIVEFDTGFLSHLNSACHISLAGNPIKEIGGEISKDVTIQFEDSDWTPKGL